MTGTATDTRPTGVTVIAIIAAVGAFFMLLGGLIMLAAGTALGVAGGGVFGLLGVGAGALMLLLGTVYAAAAYGLFTGKTWGWHLTAVAIALGVLFALLNLLAGDIGGAIFGLLLNGLVAWYLLHPNVQSWFGLSYNTPWKYNG